MNLIAAVDQNWGIGFAGQLLVRIPKDQRYFRETTTGNVVVYGRKTLEGFPRQQPLSDRENIILTHRSDLAVRGAEVVHSIEELRKLLEKYEDDRIFIIGGASVYEQMLPYCNRAYITRIDHSYQADAFFPDLDADPEWELVHEGEEETYFDLEYRFCTYERVR